LSLSSLTELLVPANRICIADIGASYLEPPPYDSLVKSGRARIIGFEPNLAECDKLRQIFGEPHQFFTDFVGRGGPATFHETSWVYTGSLFKPNRKVGEAFTGLWETMVPVAEHPVVTVALDDLLGDEVVDYVKIDVQGGELAVFEGAERLLRNTLVIHTEVEFVEMYENQPLFSDVDQYLRRQGFGLVKFLGPRSGPLRPCVFGGNVNTGGSQLLWSDALYVKKILEPEWMDVDQLARLALICHDVYQLGDVCYHLLRDHDRRTGGELASRYLAQMG
jgi:protein O-GlcNAc transferase